MRRWCVSWTRRTGELAARAATLVARAEGLEALAQRLDGQVAELESEEPTVRRLLEWSAVPETLVSEPPFGERDLEEARKLVAEVEREVGEGPFTVLSRVGRALRAHVRGSPCRAPPGARLLDVGSAPGHCAIGLVRLGHSVKRPTSARAVSTALAGVGRGVRRDDHDVEKRARCRSRRRRSTASLHQCSSTSQRGSGVGSLRLRRVLASESCSSRHRTCASRTWSLLRGGTSSEA
jgi:hypothetical protein